MNKIQAITLLNYGTVQKIIKDMLSDGKWVIYLVSCDFWLFDYMKSRLGSYNDAPSFKEILISKIIAFKTFD